MYWPVKSTKTVAQTVARAEVITINLNQLWPCIYSSLAGQVIVLLSETAAMKEEYWHRVRKKTTEENLLCSSTSY